VTLHPRAHSPRAWRGHEHRPNIWSSSGYLSGQRLSKKLTLDQLAERAGLSKSYLWELENKDPPRPSAEKLVGLAKALEVTVDYFVGDDTPEELQSAGDKAFFREYQRMTPALKGKLRQMRKLLEEDDS
jgi:transcriptional regulator with XRE-family HTH domain